MPSRSKLPRLLSAVFAAIVTGLVAAPVSASVTIDCNAGETITSALENGEELIFFSGTCNESLSIEQGRVSIFGDSPDPQQNVIAGGVQINGVGNANFQRGVVEGFVSVRRNSSAQFFTMTLRGGLSITDSSHADVFGSQVTGGSLSVTRASNLSVVDTTIDDVRGGVFITEGAMANFDRSPVTNTDNGTFVGRNGTLRFRNATMGPALVDDANLSCSPLCATDGAVIRLDSAIIEGANEDPGVGGAVSISRNSALVMRGDSSITNTGSQPVLGVFNDSSFRQDLSGASAPSTINGDVRVTAQSYVDIRAAAVNGDVDIRLQSSLRLGATSFAGDPAGTSVTGNTAISQNSALVVDDPAVTINGQITCLDKQSRLGGTFAGSGEISCKDFNNKKVKR